MQIEVPLSDVEVVPINISTLYDREHLDIVTSNEANPLVMTLATTEGGNLEPPEADYQFPGVPDIDDPTRQYFLVHPDDLPGFNEGNSLYVDIWRVFTGPVTPGRIILKAKGVVMRKLAIVPGNVFHIGGDFTVDFSSDFN